MKPRLPLVVLLLAAVAASAAAQADSGCQGAPVATREQLLQALQIHHGDAAGAALRSATLARSGQPVVGWALEIATDSGASLEARAAALQVLRLARWKPAMPELMRLAQPLRGPWVVWRGALSALTSYPYAELTPYWLDLIRYPRRVVREDALRGLAMSGDTRVLPMVREATRHEADDTMRALVADVAARLRLVPALRDTLTFGWPPDSVGGRFVPSRSHVERLGCR